MRGDHPRCRIALMENRGVSRLDWRTTRTWAIKYTERELQKKYVAASVTETAFNCPHCGALASQQWYKLYIAGLQKTPFLPTTELVQTLLDDKEIDQTAKTRFLEDMKKLNSGLIFLEKGTSIIQSK
jgi:hypothetical protein